jgi:hypothetical protein
MKLSAINKIPAVRALLVERAALLPKIVALWIEARDAGYPPELTDRNRLKIEELHEQTRQLTFRIEHYRAQLKDKPKKFERAPWRYNKEDSSVLA